MCILYIYVEFMYVEGEWDGKMSTVNGESWNGVDSKYLCILHRIEVLISQNVRHSDTPTARIEGVFWKGCLQQCFRKRIR